jgi:arsenite/tail-anchored protein-transporting ATPase
LRFIFYGGKGGVGKTTCAAAFALASSAAATSGRVLIVSTDPAHSLGDALGLRLSAAPRRIRRQLDAVELDARRAFARWLRENRRALGEILEHGTWLDAADVDTLLDLSFPGIDELVGLMEIDRFARRAQYDVIVVDTAPTGHTLRLLAAPETVGVVAGVLDALQDEHRVIRDQLARVTRGPEAADRLIASLGAQAARIASRLRDRRRTSFRWVTLPEMLSVDESLDAFHALERAGLDVDEVVVNRLLPSARPCPLCDRRRVEEQKALRVIRRRLGGRRRLRLIPADVKEPRGIGPLAALGRVMTDGSRRLTRPRLTAAKVPANTRQTKTVAPEALTAIRGASLIFFGGKGGVGKTTVAAATALRMARAAPERRILLLSTDPAHSLSDVLEAPASDEPAIIRRGPPNLRVREIDAPRALAAKRAELEAALTEIASAIGQGALGTGADRAAELMHLAPPGIDELFGIVSVIDARADYDAIVVDTAPTGHALRLLELPDAAREWVQALLRVLLKYRGLMRPGELAQELVAVAKSIRQLQALLRDRTQTRFITVTRAAETPLLETERLLRRLRRLGLSTPAVIANALTDNAGACVRCRTVAAAERQSLAALRRTLQRPGRRSEQCAIIQAPLVAPPPTGVVALERWAGRWKLELRT